MFTYRSSFVYLYEALVEVYHPWRLFWKYGGIFLEIYSKSLGLASCSSLIELSFYAWVIEGSLPLFQIIAQFEMPYVNIGCWWSWLDLIFLKCDTRQVYETWFSKSTLTLMLTFSLSFSGKSGCNKIQSILISWSSCRTNHFLCKILIFHN